MNTEETPQAPSGPSASAEDMLPPVQPPTAGFIMQLFLIPLLIVMIIVSVWLMFSWLAHKGTDPTRLVDEIERLNHSSWQRALTLANQLQDRRNSELRQNQVLAGRLAEVLESELTAGSTNERRVMLRVYLCKALGEFDVDEGVDALVKAATTERGEEDLKVRRAALQAIGFLCDRLGSEGLVSKHPSTLDAVMDASRESNIGGTDQQARARLRYNAAFTLGIIGNEAAHNRLKEMLLDPATDVRFNAAAGLARSGNPACTDTLIAMLDVSDEDLLRGEPGVDPGEEANWLTWKRNLIAETAIQSLEKLVKANPAQPLDGVAEALEKASQNERLGKSIQLEAQSALRQLESARSGAPLSLQRPSAQQFFLSQSAEQKANAPHWAYNGSR